MAETYRITLDVAAERRLFTIAQEMGRSVESLIEAAAEEAALEYFRCRASDPAKPEITRLPTEAR